MLILIVDVYVQLRFLTKCSAKLPKICELHNFSIKCEETLVLIHYAFYISGEWVLAKV